MCCSSRTLLSNCPQDAESGLYYSADGKPLVMLKPGSPGGPHPNGVAGGSSGTGSWLPCFRSRSMEVRMLAGM